MNALLKALWQSSHLYGGNATFIEDLYENYLSNPDSVPENWRKFFERFQNEPGMPDVSHAPIRAAFTNYQRRPLSAPGKVSEMDAIAAQKQAAVLRLLNAYRFRGHQAAQTDPLNLREQQPAPDLDPSYHGLGAQDLDVTFDTGSLADPNDRLPLRDIVSLLKQVYCGTIGADYMHINNTIERRWIQNRMENRQLRPPFTSEKKISLLERITAAEGLERYLHTKYVGQKRFSLEGGESLIPMLDELVQQAGAKGMKEIAIGMAHRGRLNVLVNLVGKNPGDLFAEFEGTYKSTLASGDVKYHQGFSSDVMTPGGSVHLALGFNPSHLEIINPVIEGSVRARQQRRKDHTGDQVMPILIHGDSAFAGQGVVMETLNLSKTRGYSTGGTVHIIVNNQVGFTTSAPMDMRSTLYSTDVAKMVLAPIFHVNGDDPEAVLFVTKLALDFRMEFKKDVVIDLVCYRRHGHNEADEPAATQPMMYKKIKARPTTRALYGEKLVAEGVLSAGDPERMAEEYRDKLDAGTTVARGILEGIHNDFAVDWSPYIDVDWRVEYDPTYPLDQLKHLIEKTATVPEGVEPHSRVARILSDRRKMAAGALPLDWGAAEIAAYATLVKDGYPVRISGQDSGRGTFFHRHSVVHNQVDGSSYVPLQHVSPDQGHFVVIDSVLSEEAVLAFEYGFATASPEGLTVWEAQFGDFANGAQVVFDQFISSGEQKWGRLCGLAIFLPHGYEGQGPEHSSARLERYIQLCAQFNIQVCVPTTPAQMYHMVRRQVIRPQRKPLIVMTPKSLLRHKLAVSTLEELANGHFQLVIPEIDEIEPKKVKRIVLCSGKVYYDLLEARRNQELAEVVVVRVEQLYPFPREELEAEIARYPHAKQVVWCQEEPQNQGSWYQQQHHLRACMRKNQTLHYAGRESSAAPAVGSFSRHVEEQNQLVRDALTGELENA